MIVNKAYSENTIVPDLKSVLSSNNNRILTVDGVTQSENNKCYIIHKGTKILKSIFGISILNDDELMSVDLPSTLITELSCYMAYKERNEETYNLLVNLAKNYAKNDPLLKKMKPAMREKFVLYAPSVAFDINMKIELSNLTAISQKVPLYKLYAQTRQFTHEHSMLEKLNNNITSVLN